MKTVKLEITKVILVRCNISNNNHQQHLGVFYTFLTNKPFGPILDISRKIFTFWKTLTKNFLLLKYVLLIKLLNH